MTDGDEDPLPITDSSNLDTNVIGEVYDDLTETTRHELTIEKAFNARFFAWANQWLTGGPLEDFDRFLLTANLDPVSKDDPYSDVHRRIDFLPIVWSLLL